MKIFISLFIIIFIGILACGCTSNSVNSSTEGTQTVAQKQIDPIIGEWKVDHTSTADLSPNILTYVFSQDGKLSVSNPIMYAIDSNWQPNRGTVDYNWTKISENVYEASSLEFNYNPINDTLFLSDYPEQTIYRSSKFSLKEEPFVMRISGNGDKSTMIVANGEGIRFFHINHPGSSDLRVEIYNYDDEQFVDSFVINKGQDVKSVRLSTGMYYVDVLTLGPWSITITT